MSTGAIITLATTVTLAFVGYLITYANNLRLARRSDRLNRVNAQLSDLYGPLLALMAATEAAWDKFRKQYRPGVSFWRGSTPPTEEEAAAYRLWMVTVFMPLNRRMMEVIVQHAHLVDEPDMPGCFQELCAHIVTYEPVLKKWESADTSEHLSAIVFPRRELEQYIGETYRRLKAEQRTLLGVV